ncbi:SGNH hydrolase-type esterase domain-containing protein [Aspergillus pseudoustus]|uniref:SGNH hydrolase-type esterase domain-containing protein n=1 Tax=Aspergillus pseudoustus TaxID=1810923 RepID=A0ABR4K6R4_9EURO
MAQPYDQFILFGDSLTQMSSSQEDGFGYQPALQDAYGRRLDVINRGFSGYTTANALKVLPKFFPSPRTATVRFLAIFLGCNDACDPGMSQHVRLDTFKHNLKRIIQHPAVQAHDPRIFLITPPPVNEYQLEAFDASEGVSHPSRTAARTRKYAEVALEVGSELDVPVVDLWSAFMHSVGWRRQQQGDHPLIGSRDLPNLAEFAALFTDGLHPTGKGYRIQYDAVMKTIRRTWPDQAPERLDMVFEDWRVAPV